MHLLLLSNSTNYGEEYLTFGSSIVSPFINESNFNNIVFIPYAGVTMSYDTYLEMVQKGLKNNNIKGIHNFNNPIKAIEKADLIIVGGGNSFKLLQQLYEKNVIEVIQEKVKNGTPYIGWSAGSNLACPTIKTTNDMPIAEPKSFNALNLIDFQINPHYSNKTIQGHNGESRDTRLNEFLIANPNSDVFCLPEGSYIEVDKSKIKYFGTEKGKFFRSKKEYFNNDLI